MSRFAEYDDYGDGPYITDEMWQHNVRLALSGRRGQRALRELREALLALPEKRLIANALCTVGATEEATTTTLPYYASDLREHVESQGGEGVCAVGAYAWYHKVKGGMDPQLAFATLPRLLDCNETQYETALAGQEAGLTRTFALELAFNNDDRWAGLSPERRYEACLAWIDEHLIAAVAS